MYEIVPGFAANCLVILVTNRFIHQEDAKVLSRFDKVAGEFAAREATTRERDE